LLENTLTCGLSEHEFENFAFPKFKTQLSDEIERNVSSTAKVLPDLNTSEAVENVIFIHKNLLKIIRTHQRTKALLNSLLIFACVTKSSLMSFLNVLFCGSSVSIDQVQSK
jgi:hypothetical protein